MGLMPRTEKILSIALVLLLSMNLLPAMAATQTGCPPRACDGMAGPMIHPGAAPVNPDASANHACCGTEAQRCDLGNQDPLDLGGVQAYMVSTTRVNSGHSLEMATVANQVLASNQGSHLLRSDPGTNNNDRSSPIYLLTLSLLI